MNEELIRLKALVMVQTAELHALLTLLEQFQPTLVPVFLERRKAALHSLLERQEATDPAAAALLQATIDRYCKHPPFDYE